MKDNLHQFSNLLSARLLEIYGFGFRGSLKFKMNAELIKVVMQVATTTDVMTLYQQRLYWSSYIETICK